MKRVRVPLVDVKGGQREIEHKLYSAIRRVVESGRFILGPEVSNFEKEFASYLGISYGIGVASGTDALILSLRALTIGRGDEVIIPANSYPTAFAVASTGATIKLVDVDEKTLLIDPFRIEAAITPKTRAIIPVHLYGRACAMHKIMHVAKKHKLLVIEDAAQAHGALYEGKKVGSIGDIGCFSFYPTKNLGAFGDGGMVMTNNKTLAESLRMLRMYGEKTRYQSRIIGTNSRLDELHAAILRVKLRRLDADNRKRRKIADLYRKYLSNSPVVLPQERELGSHVWHLFVLRTRKRNQMLRMLFEHGIETGIHFPVPIHQVFAFKNLGYRKGDFPVSEQAAREILSLPCYPTLKEKDIRTICNLIRDFLR